jgi:hypothetical protein
MVVGDSMPLFICIKISDMRSFLVSSILLISVFSVSAQQRIGINTNTPYRTLDVFGSANQHIRVQSTTAIGGVSGLELVRGDNGFTSLDWRVENYDGTLRILRTDDNFITSGTEALRITGDGYTGIGTSVAASVLHIDGGTQIHNNDGYLTLGNPNDKHLSFDNNSIMAWDDDEPGLLYLQANGATTYFGHTGGNTYLAQGGGNVGIGTSATDAALSVENDEFQIYLRNESAGSINDWYIGASNDNWISGGNQLLFSPTSSSSDAALRLMDVNQNNGTTAPVMIYTNYDHTILLDGDEIDTRGTPLYINHNSDQDTYLNPSGGQVGIGNWNPGATLHITSSIATPALTLERNGHEWDLDVQTGGNQNFVFLYDDLVWGEIHGVSGQYLTFSDARRKEYIKPLSNILDRVIRLPVYSYSFKHDSANSTHFGVMAQDLLPYFPELVKDHEGQYGVVYAQLAVLALKAIQEQQTQIDLLREKLSIAKATIAKTHEAEPQD